MEPMTIEEFCAYLRSEIEGTKCVIVGELLNHADMIRTDKDLMLSPGNIPAERRVNMKENITLAFRHLEDARMRLGKVMQAYQGGVSIFDRDGQTVSGPESKTPEVSPDRLLAIAQACHEANREYCISIGDHSQQTWKDTAQWQRDSAIDGVKHAIAGDRTPAEQHEAWVLAKVKAGWTYAAVKDGELREHPCLVPYDQLPNEQKEKDQIFLDVVHNCMSEDE